MTMFDDLLTMQQTLRAQGVAPEAVLVSRAVLAELERAGAPLVRSGSPPTRQVLGMRIYVSAAIPQDAVYMMDAATLERMLARLAAQADAE